MTAPEGREASRSTGQATALLGPRLHVRPVPGGATAHRPTWFGQEVPEAPDVDRLALDVETGGDLGDADGVAVAHEATVANVLTTGQDCSDTRYMTTTRAARYADIELAEIEAHIQNEWTAQPRTCADFDARDARLADLGAAHAALMTSHYEFCTKCEGAGRIPSKHARGLCYECKGTGVQPLRCSICGRPTPSWEHTVCDTVCWKKPLRTSK